jgi:ATP-dependent protease ClpP protease subunit
MDYFGDGVDANALIDELEALDVDELDVRINSPGGSAWDGVNIANAIMRHKATTTTWIDGLAASAASMIAVAGDRVVMSKYGQMMLHNARAVVIGTAKDMRETAAALEKLNLSIATLYADRAGGEPTEWARAMSRETWYNADEAIAAGLAHEVDESAARDAAEAAVASALQLVPPRMFTYAGRQAAPAPTSRANPTGGPHMADKKDVAKSLGLPDDATDEQIRAKFAEIVGVDADGNDTDGGANPPDAPADPPAATPEPVPAGATAKADGDRVVLDKATYEQLMSGATAGAQAAATLQAQADARVVDSAIDSGKIMASRRDHYLAEMKLDRAHVTNLLETVLQPGAAVPLNELGHGMDADPAAQAAAQAEITDPKFIEWKVD